MAIDANKAEFKVKAPTLAMSKQPSPKLAPSPAKSPSAAPHVSMSATEKSQQLQVRKDIENQINKLQQQAKQLQKSQQKKPDTFKQIALNLVKVLTLTGKNALAERKLRQPQMKAALQQLSRGSKAIAGLVKQLKLDNNNSQQADNSAAPTPTADPTQAPTPRPKPSSPKDPRSARLANNIESCASTAAAASATAPIIAPSKRLTDLAKACAGAIEATKEAPAATTDKGL